MVAARVAISATRSATSAESPARRSRIADRAHAPLAPGTKDPVAYADERTLLVAVSHVLFRSAYVMDAERIVRHAHAHGALVMLDAYHSVGVLPVDVQALGADFAAGGVLKWLCGGPGAARRAAADGCWGDSDRCPFVLLGEGPGRVA